MRNQIIKKKSEVKEKQIDYFHR